ncbi:MAG: methionyl-tRNA formyltransferase [Sphingobacteriales bacterium]
MRIILLSGASFSIPSMNFFGNAKIIQSVACIGQTDKENIHVEHSAALLNLPFKRFLKDQLLTEFKNWLGDEQPDMVLVFGCAYKIPEELFLIPKLGFFNVHFSLLPAYRGSNPLFWQLKNGDTAGGISIHQMTDEYDNGPILIQQETPIFQGENHGLISNRLSLESIGLIAKGIEKLEHKNDFTLNEQSKNTSFGAPEPVLDDLKINWETQSAKEIENLVNAANPNFGGAVTVLRGQIIRILEVNPAEINNPSPVDPGTIVHSDTGYGIFVACKDMQFLRINILQSTECLLSGFKLASLGVAPGERFQSAAELSGISVKL